MDNVIEWFAEKLGKVNFVVPKPSLTVGFTLAGYGFCNMFAKIN